MVECYEEKNHLLLEVHLSICHGFHVRRECCVANPVMCRALLDTADFLYLWYLTPTASYTTLIRRDLAPLALLVIIQKKSGCVVE